MSLVTALQKIADDLARIAREPEINPSDIDLAATRIAMQIEMIEMGIDSLEPAS